MKHRVILIIIVLWGCFPALVGLPLPDVQDNKEERLVKADSIDRLVELIKSALIEKDSKRLEQIKNMNTQLIQGNLSLAIQECGKYLKESVSNELSGNTAVSREDIRIAQILAEMYEEAEKSTYLSDKVCKLRKWNRNKKEKWIEANKLWQKGYECYLNYKFNDVINFCDKSKNLYKEIRYKEGEANCFYLIGNAHNMLDEYDKAEQMYKDGLILIVKMKNPLEEANCIRGLGVLNEMLGKYDKAIQLYNDSLAIYRRINDRLRAARCLFNIGAINKKLSKFDEALRFYNESLRIYREIKDRRGEADCIREIGAAYGCLDKYEEARQHYEEALNIFQELNDQYGVFACKKRLGDYYKFFHEHEKALQMLNDTLIFSRKIKSRHNVSVCLTSLGDYYKFLEEYDKANKCYEESLEISRELKSRSLEALCLKNMGISYLKLQKYEKARQLVEESLVICREIKERYGEAYCLFFLGDLHRELSEYDYARQRYEESLMIFREIKSRYGEANCLQHLGDVYRLKSDFKKAFQYLEEGLAIFRDLNNRLGEANCIQGIGNVYWSLSDYKNAADQHQKALSIHAKIHNRFGVGASFCSLGYIFEINKNFPAAEKNYKKSISIIEETWHRIKLDEYKTQFFAVKVKPYESIIDILFKRGDGKNAFYYAERSKARSFLYLLGNKRIDLKHGVSPDLAKKEEELRQKINSITVRIMENEKKEAARRVSTEKLNDQLLRFKQKHSEIIETMKLQSPEYASLKSVNPLSVEEIQKLLRRDGGTVLVEYYTTKEATYLWVLNGRQLYPYKIDIDRETLNKRVRQFRTLAADRASGIGELRPRALMLYKLLFKPIEKHIRGKSRIAVVPHGILHYLPFEALMNKGKFLGEQDVKIFYLPSASVYKYCRDKNSFKKDRVMAIANPDGTLPYSEKEVKAITTIYTKEAKVLLGEDAKESTVRKNASYPDILHFASHGRFDPDHPMYSSLGLAPDPAPHPADDGRLEVTEIFNLKLKPAYLVTLSACETKLGGIYHGDEIVGLSRAFIYAGTPSIVAGLWKVDDRYTAEFMTAFYRALKTNNKIDALDIARRAMIEEHGKRHPFYWAAFVLIGDYR